MSHARMQAWLAGQSFVPTQCAQGIAAPLPPPPPSQAWFAGHDHSLEHLYVDSASYHIIVSGAGSKCDRSFTGARHSRYQWPSSGGCLLLSLGV